MNIILASKSQRRKDLLDLIGVKYKVIISNADETLEQGLTIEEQSKKLAYIKAKAVFEQTSGDRLVIGSDTMVVKDKKLYGKPKDKAEAIQMLKTLQGDKHQVITSLCVLVQKNNKYEEYLDYDITEVYVKKMSNQEIEQYVNKNNTLDQAGAYAIQGQFAAYIEKINGNYTTIVGLPVHKVYDIVKKYKSDKQ